VADGETAKAFHRLSVLLRQLGSRSFGITTWLLIGDDDLHAGGCLSPERAEYDTAFEDLYRVLWYFERVKTASTYNLVNESVLFETIGFHCWWWNEILRDLHSPKAVRAIRDLGEAAEHWARTHSQYENWCGRCATDFAGGPCTKQLRGGASEGRPVDAGSLSR
jgi:hypothetical protein